MTVVLNELRPYRAENAARGIAKRDNSETGGDGGAFV